MENDATLPDSTVGPVPLGRRGDRRWGGGLTVRALRVPSRVDGAVRALVHLARCRDGGSAKVHEISAASGIPARFLSLLLVDLRDRGLVRSLRGPGGGYWLGRPPEEISVADVFDAVDHREPVSPLVAAPLPVAPGSPPRSPVPLANGNGAAAGGATGAGRQDNAVTEVLWSRIEDDVRSRLAQISIADLAAGRLVSPSG